MFLCMCMYWAGLLLAFFQNRWDGPAQSWKTCETKCVMCGTQVWTWYFQSCCRHALLSKCMCFPHFSVKIAQFCREIWRNISNVGCFEEPVFSSCKSIKCTKFCTKLEVRTTRSCGGYLFFKGLNWEEFKLLCRIVLLANHEICGNVTKQMGILQGCMLAEALIEVAFSSWIHPAQSHYKVAPGWCIIWAGLLVSGVWMATKLTESVSCSVSSKSVLGLCTLFGLVTKW